MPTFVTRTLPSGCPRTETSSNRTAAYKPERNRLRLLSSVPTPRTSKCCRMLLGCIEGLPVECRDTRRHRLALSGVSESEQHPHPIGNRNFKLGQHPAAELVVSDISSPYTNPMFLRTNSAPISTAAARIPDGCPDWPARSFQFGLRTV